MDIRPSLAGIWYTGDRLALKVEVERFLDEARVHVPPGQIVGLVVPHAGLMYSGRIAAHAFKCASSFVPRLVCVIGRMHYRTDYPVLTTEHEAYGTPLGISPVDHDLLRRFNQQFYQLSGLALGQLRNDPEHSIEIELPFIQHLFGEVPLLPLMLSDTDLHTTRSVGHILAEILDPSETLVIASSDLSHFYPETEAVRMDHEMLRRIEAHDPERVFHATEEGVAFACGRTAIASLLWATENWGADHASVVAYGTSGDINRDYESVVGYAAVVVWKGPNPATPASSVDG